MQGEDLQNGNSHALHRSSQMLLSTVRAFDVVDILCYTVCNQVDHRANTTCEMMHVITSSSRFHPGSPVRPGPEGVR